jgi:quercetin dioxygenase-like cupin family protein
MRIFFCTILALFAVAPATAQTAKTPPGTCAIVFGPQPIPQDAAHQAFAIHMDIAPGRVANWHTHPAAEYIGVTSGTGWLEIQGKPRVELVPGHVYAVAPGVLHRAHNTSASAHLIWTGFFVGRTGGKTHTVLKNGAGPWTPGCATHL